MKIAIIGAGPAGIEAAAVLASRGAEVVLFEKEPQPLHNIADKAFLFPNFAKAQDVASRLLSRLDSSRITLRTGVEVKNIAKEAKGWQVEGAPFDRVLLATGYTPFDARRKEELGYRIYEGVYTSLDMEQMLREGKVVNIVGEKPQRVAFLQCVGSRDEKVGNNYCSKLCCITAVKQAIEVRKLLPDTEVYVFYMDLRMWGQGFEELYREAQFHYDVKFVRGRISEASSTFNRKIQIKAEDTLMGRPMKLTTDLLVLMVGMEPSCGTRCLGQQMGISGDYGFMQSLDPHTGDNLTSQNGLYVAGSCKRPMTLSDTLADARAAACEMLVANDPSAQ